MAAGNKSKTGNRTDYAKHYSLIDGGSPVCSNSRYGYSTNDVSDVDCVKCMAWLLGTAADINNKFKENKR